MRAYLVGGAVRDELLGRPVNDLDYVVTGATVEQMLNFGFNQVGADFPVFLHPLTNDEYALARTERKQGHGYHGFTVDFNPEVTIEEDLIRRDLTINAMAKSSQGTLVDPYDGRKDLNDRVLRHVSDAFVEDPLRVLRVARFAAQLAELGFSVAKQTNELMQQLANNGELTHLTVERVFKETEKALNCEQPHVYFEVLAQCGALQVLFEELSAIDLAAVAWSKKCSQSCCQSAQVAWAVALNQCDEQTIASMCQRLKVPQSYEYLAIKLAKWRPTMIKLELCIVDKQDVTSMAEAVADLLTGIDVYRRSEILAPFVCACGALAKVHSYTSGKVLTQAYEVCNKITAARFIEQGLKGKAIGEHMRMARIEVIGVMLQHVSVEDLKY